MGIKLESIIPLGRRAQEYKDMFNLSRRDLDLKIIDCGGGTSSFNAETNEEGKTIISIDPIYQFTEVQIQSRIDATFEIMMEQAGLNKEKFCWNQISSVQELKKMRKVAMKKFMRLL